MTSKKSVAFFLLSIFLSFLLCSIEKDLGLPGNRWPCSNEGEEVAPKTNIANIKCFKCICQVGMILQKYFLNIVMFTSCLFNLPTEWLRRM